MKTPVTYYGGKQTMLKYIMPLIPDHRVYDEPFFGGGAVFFAKKEAKCELINDVNDRGINFYKVYQTRAEELRQLVNESMLSRKQHELARGIYQSPNGYSDIEKAWSFWFLGNTSFNGDFYGNIKFSRSENRSYTYLSNSKRQLVNPKLIKRLEKTQIDNRDALLVIPMMDQPLTFHYIDPPYMNTDQGHYSGYSWIDFGRLLLLLGTIKGKFLLSCYDGDMLQAAISRFGWNYRRIQMSAPASAMHGQRAKKIEMLVMNYQPAQTKLQF